MFGAEVQAADKKQVIKFSTLAPEGSSWMKQLRNLSEELKKKTDGRVVFKFYPGGVSGDEKDVIRKMRIGQLHGAGFTGVGLGAILPEVRVLDLPFLFENDQQVEHVYQEMDQHFRTRYEKKGFILLGWVPVGWVHFFSAREIQKVDDLKPTKPWMWEGDPLVEETYDALGIRPVPLSITEVLISLQTGLIDTVYASPMGALALQWFTKVKYMSEVRMGFATGGVLITKKKFKKLSAEDRETLIQLGKKHLGQLVKIIGEDNTKSLKIIQKAGVQLVPAPESGEVERFHKAGAMARDKLAGKLFSKDLLETVLAHLKNSP